MTPATSSTGALATSAELRAWRTRAALALGSLDAALHRLEVEPTTERLHALDDLSCHLHDALEPPGASEAIRELASNALEATRAFSDDVLAAERAVEELGAEAIGPALERLQRAMTPVQTAVLTRLLTEVPS